jgi:AcrR family transcriptional regulator
MPAPTTLDDRQALIDAGLALLRGHGAETFTVNDVLVEAGLSTRAFYRHFASKEALVLAVYEQDARRSSARLRDRMTASGSIRGALEVWIDETLALGFAPARAKRTRPLAREGLHLQAQFPQEFAKIVAGIIDPLVAVLRLVPTADPERDARTMHTICWSLVQEKLAGGKLTREEARAHARRFCLPVIGEHA